jgi:hypothetical protein
MNLSFRLIAKFGLLLVVIGFFNPIVCNMNGLKIADYMVKNNHAFEGILLYVLLISAIAGVLLGVLFLMNKGLAANIDWIVVIACIASGLIVYLRVLKRGPDLQSGAHLILIGWIIALGGQILSKIKNE